MDSRSVSRPKPAPVTGLAHVFSAGSYSLSGLVRLWQETAFRHEVLLFLTTIGLFVFLGAAMTDLLILAGLFLLLVAVEALNTAIECIVDHLAPEWSLFAKNAKDLGSLAVMCCLICAGLFVGSVIIGRIGF
ncbi:MAG: diacylglycerol kinase [Albidovulum sp.]